MTELEQALAQIEILREENRLLRQKLDYVIRQLHGAKSEKLDPDQLDLFGELDGLGKPDSSAADKAAGTISLHSTRMSCGWRAPISAMKKWWCWPSSSRMQRERPMGVLKLAGLARVG